MQLWVANGLQFHLTSQTGYTCCCGYMGSYGARTSLELALSDFPGTNTMALYFLTMTSYSPQGGVRISRLPFRPFTAWSQFIFGVSHCSFLNFPILFGSFELPSSLHVVLPLYSVAQESTSSDPLCPSSPSFLSDPERTLNPVLGGAIEEQLRGTWSPQTRSSCLPSHTLRLA